MSEQSTEKVALMTEPHDGHGVNETCPGCPHRAETEHTTVARFRLPRDESFLYVRLDRNGRRFLVHVELIQRRYHSPKRVEVMRFHKARAVCGPSDVHVATNHGSQWLVAHHSLDGREANE